MAKKCNRKRTNPVCLLALALAVLIAIIIGINSCGSDSSNEAPVQTPEVTVVEEDTEQTEEKVYEVLKNDHYDGNHAFGNGQTIGYDQGFRYVCWGFELNQAVTEMTKRFVPEAKTTKDERVLDFVAGMQDGVVHAYRDAADGNIGGDIVGKCKPLADMKITDKVVNKYEAHLPMGKAEFEEYKHENRHLGGDHVDNDGDLHDEGVNAAHDKNRSDAYFAGEGIAYADTGLALMAPCWGYELDEALAEGIKTELPKNAGADMIAGYTDGFRSSFADGINERNQGNCKKLEKKFHSN